ncbi:hypothetical protein FGX01_02130, partial [Xylella fastidiosa subsp. multiplex]|nr:hypothetical protein [Xylella fastidiosa subsp. multiplex]
HVSSEIPFPEKNVWWNGPWAPPRKGARGACVTPRRCAPAGPAGTSPPACPRRTDPGSLMKHATQVETLRKMFKLREVDRDE